MARAGRRLARDRQMRKAARSIAANIREAYGRRVGPERNPFFRFARSSAEVVDEHLRANFRRHRVEPATFWRVHNRIVVIVRMLNALMGE